MALVRWSEISFGKYIPGLSTLGYEKGPGPDIVAGLESAFTYLFSFATWSNALPAIFRFGRNTQAKKEVLRLLSYFKQWAPIYDSYNSGRKARWTAYWDSLPFGSHAGANGYPGSGFSALVYLNAWRTRLGDFFLHEPFAMYLSHGDTSLVEDWLAYSPTLGLFVASGASPAGGGVYYSSDGINWDFSFLSSSSIRGKVRWLAGANVFAMFYFRTTQWELWTSTDGINWTQVQSYSFGTPLDIAYSPVSGNYVITINTGSGDGALFGTDITTTTQIANADFDLAFAIAYSPTLNRFASIATDPFGFAVYTSDDGETWTRQWGLPGSNWRDICWSAAINRFVAIEDDTTHSHTASSLDGYTWDYSEDFIGRSFRALADSPALGYVFATDFAENPSSVVYSTDGINWIDVYQFDFTNARGIAASGSLKMICVGGFHSRGYSQGRLYGTI